MNALVDPAFVLEAERGLRLSAAARARVPAPEAWAWLAMRVARRPQELRAHVQRIRLLADCGEAGRLFGALVDLYTVLGEQGQGLRAALLAEVRAVLDEDDHAYLQAHLERGLGLGEALPQARAAVTVRGTLGTGEALVKVVARAARSGGGDPHEDDPFHVPAPGEGGRA